MKISIFTPTHDTRWLAEAYKSIKDQDFYEWIVLYNNGAKPIDFGDPRVKAFDAGNVLEWVGPLKAAACEQATGDVLLELDHDDLLTPDAIEEVKKAFADPEVGFVYSNTIHAGYDLKRVGRFDEKYGWRYREVTFRGNVLDEHIHFEPTPNCVSRIWFAPNHLRAFRRPVYQQIGGYSKKMRVLDDLDIMCRMYCATKFHHIDKGLYVYRIHGENTWLKNNHEIQENVHRLHDQYVEDLCEAWARREGLKLVDLGGRIACRKGFTSVDLRDADIISDLNGPWPFESGSVGMVRAYDIFEHLRDPIHVMMELHRILAVGGYAIIQVPSTDGRGAFQDPRHVSFWNQNSFLYYSDRRFNKYIDCPVRFQLLRTFTTAPNDDMVCWTKAHMVKLGTDRVPGEVNI